MLSHFNELFPIKLNRQDRSYRRYNAPGPRIATFNCKVFSLNVVEAFTTFIKVEDSFAIGLRKLITNSIEQKGLHMKNFRGQG